MFKAAVIVTINNEYALSENFFTWVLAILPKNYQLITVVDGVTDTLTYQFLQKIHEEYDNLEIRFLHENVGFSIANNIAVELADAEYLIFLNSDTFPTEGSLETLITYLENNKETGVVQGMIISPQNNKVQSAGHIFAFYKTTHAFDGRDIDDPIVTKEYERQALASGFYAMASSLYKKFGGFDDLYYNAWEGLELSLKVHCSGQKCMYIPTAKAYHVKGSGRGRIFRDETYQSAYFWAKWSDKIQMDISTVYLEQLEFIDHSGTYFGINTSSYRDNIWVKILEDLPICCPGFFNVTRALSSSRVSFEDSIPYSILHAQNNILFVSDQFATILNNHRFFQFRDKAKDIILDIHGNVICPQQYYQILGSR